MSTHARPLAVWLAAATDSQLATLLAARGVRTDAAWQDFFDAAEALLEPASIERVLPRLTRQEATALRNAVDGGSAEPETEALISLALLRADGTPSPPVADAVAAHPLPDPAGDLPPSAPASEAEAAHAAERAFTSVAIIADLLLIARDSPLSLLTGGDLGAGEKRRLAEAGVPADAVDDLLALAAEAALVRVAGRQLHLTSVGEAWLRLSAAERWGRVAAAFRDALPRGLRNATGGWIPVAAWNDQHPWDQTWPDRWRTLRRRAQLLGLIADDDSEPEWSVPLREGDAVNPDSLRRMLPTEVDRIFLQNDLSAIAPGPLAPALDVRLRSIAERESAAQASSYRFTAESISHALVVGETAQSILTFLGELSLTGIPQPLDYLVTQTAGRHGLVRVWAETGSERTRIDSVDAHLLDAIGVDQALRPLGLIRDSAGLTSRVGRETVYWALTDARYPATIVDADGSPLAVQRNPIATTEQPPPASYAPLVSRLRAQQGPDADAAWLDRELEAAVRTKAVLLVEVGMPDGSTKELTLEASGMGGGRLRGRDRAADVERTLPVSSIRSARVIEAS